MTTASGSHSGYMVKVIAPLIGPTVWGANNTPSVQLAPALNPKLQGFVPAETTLKSPLTLSGISATPDRSMRLVTTTILAELVVPTACAGKFKEAGLNWSSGKMCAAR